MIYDEAKAELQRFRAIVSPFGQSAIDAVLAEAEKQEAAEALVRITKIQCEALLLIPTSYRVQRSESGAIVPPLNDLVYLVRRMANVIDQQASKINRMESLLWTCAADELTNAEIETMIQKAREGREETT